ncbi:carboxypeptidase-like regulatory domain-containing protein [Prevotella sp. E2-28]|uniref:carboxypeptidase-like regulatory domain-containing protein n=1 Tax=Prevotella sp. E2-28 TaxID=2913620 RepID=UPI001ED9DDD1|nr:carboxypeptidase-like regulatory domain-containing protein [Prevotella sp. E2-28]UKK53521.1 carboxypeptidase-like regulatory domain-containing protein [Prevotella sp. E2-28]
MKRLLYIILYIASVATASAQVKVTGRVTDLHSKPVSDVIVKLTSGTKTLAFTSTNVKGEYGLELKSAPSGEVSFLFNHVSYEKESKKLTLKEKAIKVDMVLTPKEVSLKEVTVKPDPLKQRGDTLSYNLASFLKKGDVTLEDGLKNLPGISIADNGAISYMGKGISDFYIGGLDMLGGRYNLATKNIPAEYATQVDIMKHHKHRKIDADEESDAVAINIKLSKKAQFKPFGQPEFGVGMRENKLLYAAGVTEMLFTDNFQLLASGKYSNNGNFGLYDMVNHNGGDSFGSLATNKLPGWGQVGSGVGESIYRRNGYGSLNAIQKIDSVRQIRVNADYTYERMNSSASSEAYYFAGGENIYIAESITPLAKAHRPTLNMKFENNASNHYFSDTFSAKAQFLTNESPSLTCPERGNDVVLNSQHRDATSINLNNNLWTTIRMGKRKLSFTSNVEFIRTPEVLMLMNENAQRGQSSQLNTRHGTSLQIKLGRKWKIDMPVSLTANYNFIETELTKPDIAYQSQRMSGWKLVPSINPSISWTSADKKLYSSMGLNMKLLNLNYLSKYDDKRTTLSEVFAEPHVFLRYTFNGTSELTFSSGFSNAAGDILDLLTTPVQINYRSTSAASGVIGKSQSWSSDIRYTKQVPFSYFTFGANASYSQGKRNVLSSRIVSQAATESTSIFRDSHSRSASGGINASKNILPLFTKLSANADVSWGSSEYMMQSRFVTSYHTGYSMRLQADVTPFTWLEANIKGDYGKNFLRANSSNQSSDNLRFTGSLAVFPIPTIEIRSTCNFMHDMIEPDKYKDVSMLSASVQYKTKRAVWKLTGENLLDVRQYTRTSFLDTDRFVHTTNLVGRTMMLTCKLLLASK